MQTWLILHHETRVLTLTFCHNIFNHNNFNTYICICLWTPFWSLTQLRRYFLPYLKSKDVAISVEFGTYFPY